ncbi:T9SS type A sorting domain-containing protein [Flavobacteriaceae bacterium]|nr:T9SS type A sorting domain-containing protein [Flavobacteriaceae bacterium]
MFRTTAKKALEVYNPEAYQVNEANIYDMSGKLVYFAYALGNASYFSFPTYNFADGVYLVRMVTENNGVVSYKLSVSNR